MAKKTAKTSEPAATAAAPNLELLAKIAEASKTEGGYMHVSDADAAPLLAAGLIVQNAGIKDGSGTATRTTDEGNKMAAQQTAAAPKPAEKAPAPQFQIASNVPMPDSQRRGVQRSESYPFSKLEKDQSFFIAATEKKPQPERSYASTVSSARNRYAVKHPTETRVNRKGKTVPQETFERDFAIRPVADGAAWGQPGVKGAAVFRTK